MNLGIEQSELFLQLIEDFQSSEKLLAKLRPELAFVLENYIVSQNPQTIISLFVLLTEQDILEIPYFRPIVHSNIYKCFHLINAHISISEQIITLLLEHSDLSELHDFLQCPQLPLILGQPNSSLVILRILKDNKIGQRQAMIQFIQEKELLDSQIIIHLFSIPCASLFENFLKNLDKLNILNKKNILNLFQIGQLIPFIDAFQHIPSSFTENNPQQIFELLSQVNSVNFIFTLDFTHPIGLSNFLEIFSEKNQSRLSLLSSLGFINSSNRFPPHLLLAFLKLPETSFSLFISQTFSKKIFTSEFIKLLISKNLTVEKLEEALITFNTLESNNIFTAPKDYFNFAKFFFDYNKPFRINTIIQIVIQRHQGISFSHLLTILPYYENRYVILEIFKNTTAEEIQTLPENLKLPIQAFIESQDIAYSTLLNLVNELFRTPEESLPEKFKHSLSAHFIGCMRILKNVRFFNEDLVHVLLSKNKKPLSWEVLHIFTKKLETLENYQSEPSFKNELSLLQSNILPAVLSKAMDFENTQEVLDVFISLYFLKILHSRNQEIIFSIFDSMNKSLSFKELKTEFFIRFTQMQGSIQTRDFTFLIHQKINYLVLLKRARISNQF